MIADFTVVELAKFDGSDPSKPLLLSVQGQVFDMSAGKDFYGPGGPYAVFAGKECARALATMSLKPEDMGREDLEGLEDVEKATKILQQWVDKFKQKYPLVGKLVK